MSLMREVHTLTECTVTFNSAGIVTKRTLKNSILYSYDKDGKLVKKTITTEGKSTPDCVIRYDNENRIKVAFVDGLPAGTQLS